MPIWQLILISFDTNALPIISFNPLGTTALSLSLSIPLVNIRKHLVFLCFQGCVERDQYYEMVYSEEVGARFSLVLGEKSLRYRYQNDA